MANVERRPHLCTIALSLLGTAVAIAGLYLAHESHERAHRFMVEVFSADGPAQAIQGATVSLGTVQILSGQTDANGAISFLLPDDAIGKSALISVQANDFQPVNQTEYLEPSEDYHRIKLYPKKKETPPSPRSVPTPVPTPPKTVGGDTSSIDVHQSDNAPQDSPDRYDVTNAKGCGFASPITLSALRVARTKVGFEAVVTLTNSSSDPASVVASWRGPLGSLQTESSSQLTTVDGLVPEGKFIFWNGGIKPDVFDEKFDSGLQIPPAKSSKFILSFQASEFSASSRATLTIKILALTKLTSGEPKLRYESITCTDALIVK